MKWLKIGGLKGWVINLVITRLYKKIWLKKTWPAIQGAYHSFMQKLVDNTQRAQLADELAKGKDSDATQELKDQNDILNGPRH